MTPNEQVKSPAEYAPDDLKMQIKRAILNLTDEQTEYVLSRLSSLKKGEENE